MIEPQHLRIGNLVNASVFGGKGKSEWVHLTGVIHTIGIDTVKLGEGIVFEHRHLKPIPLTEEILLKVGFEKMKLDRYSYLEMKVNNTKYITNDKGNVLIGVCGPAQYEYLLLELEYLHQLQNIHFMLTGQELNTTGLIL